MKRILLIICLVLIQGIDTSLTKYCFILTGLWWIGFSQYTYARLPDVSLNKAKQKNNVIFCETRLAPARPKSQKQKPLTRVIIYFFGALGTYFKDKILKKIIFPSKELNQKKLNKFFKTSKINYTKIQKVLFCSVVPKSFNLIKKYLSNKT